MHESLMVNIGLLIFKKSNLRRQRVVEFLNKKPNKGSEISTKRHILLANIYGFVSENLRLNISTVHLDSLRIIHDCKWITEG